MFKTAKTYLQRTLRLMEHQSYQLGGGGSGVVLELPVVV